jgi:hypothetical protein
LGRGLALSIKHIEFVCLAVINKAQDNLDSSRKATLMSHLLNL